MDVQFDFILSFLLFNFFGFEMSSQWESFVFMNQYIKTIWEFKEKNIEFRERTERVERKKKIHK